MQPLPINTLVGCSIGNWSQANWGPFKGDDTYIAVTHSGLTQEIEAVFWNQKLGVTEIRSILDYQDEA